MSNIDSPISRVRFNISLPRWLDDYVKTTGYTRSSAIEQALRSHFKVDPPGYVRPGKKVTSTPNNLAPRSTHGVESASKSAETQAELLASLDDLDFGD